MQDIDQRDRELLGALQGEIPVISTPFAVLGQIIDMSEKEVIKRTERLKREGVVRQVSAQFDAHALGYRSCLVAAKVNPDRIDQSATIVNADLLNRPGELGVIAPGAHADLITVDGPPTRTFAPSRERQ